MAKKKKERTEPLNDFEVTCLIGAFRYYMPRRTIVSATFPEDFVKAKVFNLISDQDLGVLVQDLKWHLRQHKAFGDENIDDPTWKKLLGFLEGKLNGFEKVKLINDEEIEVFRAHYHQLATQVHDLNTGETVDVPEGFIERIYPVKEYVQTPWAERYVPIESIKEFLTKTS